MLEPYERDLNRFMNTKRYTENSTVPHTHRSWGCNLQGRFLINNPDDLDEFYKLYVNAVKHGSQLFSIQEVQKEYSSIVVDIDLKVPIEDHDSTERLYTDETILNVIDQYYKVFDKYLQYKKSEVFAYVFTKEKATETDDYYKDGFHIMFPKIVLNSKMRHFVRLEVINLCNEMNLFSDFNDPVDIIIDKAVVSSNAWFLYGSKKHSGHMYSLYRVYTHTHKVREYDISRTKQLTHLIKHLSFYSNEVMYEYSGSTKLLNKELIEQKIHSIDVPKPSMSVSNSRLNELCDNVIAFLNMLKPERAVNYEDWRNVGLALHNTNEDMLPYWIEFSSRSKDKFNEKECYAFWKSCKTKENGSLLTIKSLAYWAKLDSPREYDDFVKNEMIKRREQSIIKISNYAVAKAFHAKYMDKFICSSIKSNTWWEFKTHRWEKIEDAYTIKILLSEDFQNDYRRDIIDCHNKAMNATNDDEKKLLDDRITIMEKIITLLLSTDYKKKVIEELKSLFYDAKFEEKIDSNINLLGFENGVYDLTTNVFRNGTPDDYITLSTKNNYKRFSESMRSFSNVKKFLEQIIPNENVRDYFIQVLASCLTGSTKEEKLYILNGSGANGKSLLMDLLNVCLGDYFMTCPITMITSKRGKSNETSPEKVRMKGKRCGVFQETDDGEKMNIGIVKELTGGDKILVRDLYKGSNDMIEFKPQMKYFLTCNQLPIVPSNDDGIWRRLRVIDFVTKFKLNPTKPNEMLIDTSLKHKIDGWGGTLISYLLHIYTTKYVNKNYLQEPQEVMFSTNQYKCENDTYQDFVNKLLITTNKNTDRISKQELYITFKNWYKLNYESRGNLPSVSDFEKNICKIITNISDGCYCKIKFNKEIDETLKNGDIEEDDED